MPYVASVSFGKDSLAMLLLLLEHKYPLDEVVFYDTGAEFDAIYRNAKQCENILGENDIPFTTLRPETPFFYKMFAKPVKYRKPINGDEYHYGYEWCGGCRWGTTDKIATIKKYLSFRFPNQPVYEYVGIAFDEQHGCKTDNPYKVYPLIEHKMTEKDCLQYCYNKGFNWNKEGIELYSILDRVYLAGAVLIRI